MSKITRKSRDELVKRLMEALLVRLDTPLPLTVPEVNLECPEIDEDWSLFNEIHSELLEGKPDPGTILRLKATVSGTKPITIRVPNRVLQVYRQQADKKGVPYQKLMNRALADAADAMA